MVRLTLFCSLMLPVQLFATPVYESKDEFGRPVFSDTPPGSEHKTINIEIQNDYEWNTPDLHLKRNKKSRYKKRTKRRKKAKKFSFAELQGKCQRARYRYQNYRGTRNSSDWGSYKAKLIKYSKRRDYWCSRALKRK